MTKRKRPAENTEPSAPSNRLLSLLSSPLRIALAAVAAIALVAAIGGGAILVLGGGDDAPPPAADGLKTAAIIDQLSLSQPNPDFSEETRRLLAQAGYLVDYFPGEEVTVNFYRTLPERDYDLVIMRVHAGITTEVDAETGERTPTEYVSLFSGEPYEPGKYPEERLNRLGKASYYEGAPPLFGIGPDFVAESMEGRFNDTLVVMMGCDGLRSQRTAQAFLDKGAKAFISWSEPVSASHTDAATQKLLERIYLKGLPPEQAVAETADEVGPDPFYDGELRMLAGG